MPIAMPPAAGARLTGQTGAQPVPVTVQTSQDLSADDADLIEKEWVERAKNIIAQTSHDPHLQNKEINKIKADYIRKRYNKDVKVNEA
jgi:hypothetical protein